MRMLKALRAMMIAKTPGGTGAPEGTGVLNPRPHRPGKPGKSAAMGVAAQGESWRGAAAATGAAEMASEIRVSGAPGGTGVLNPRPHRLLSGLLIVALIIGVTESAAMAWEQPAHKVINEKAVDRFNGVYAKGEKYKDAQVKLDRYFKAPYVNNSGYFGMSFGMKWDSKTGKEQIIEGGFSADEPNIFVSVKHFYDPLALSGKHELTDQETGHGMVYEAIPATQWALTREDNPYSLKNALQYYKKACEIPYTAQAGVIPATNADFRDLEGTAGDLEEMRNMYAGKALRGLGEVMHLVADMTQPAHVRNDSHPRKEISEQTMTGSLARALAGGGRLDDFDMSSTGGLVQNLMVNLSTWTNARFYSMDTIYDSKLKVNPANGELPYSSPQISNLTQKIWERQVVYMSAFAGTQIPIVKKNIGVLWDSYEINPDVAKENGKVQIPLAVSACAKTMDMFFPTLKLEQTVAESEPSKELSDEAIGKGAEELKMFLYDAEVKHLTGSDPQWSNMGLAISYSGPGKLWALKGRRLQELCDVEFVNGKIEAYKDPLSGEIKEGKPVFYMVLGASKKIGLSDVPAEFMVEMEDTISCTAIAGAQSLFSEDYTFEMNEPEITLEVDRSRMMPGEKAEFKVEIENAPERYKIEWTFGDEEDDEENIKPPVVNRKKEMVHIYEREKEYTATVKLIDTKRKVVRASDSVDISVYMGELSGPWDLQLTIQEENSFFRAIIVGIMKVMVNVILIPIVRAFGGDPASVDKELEQFTFVGSTITYEMELRRSEDDESVYEGPIVYVGAESDFMEGSEDLYSVRVEIIKGKIVIFGIGVDEYGEPVEMKFLDKGRMISEDELAGTFSYPGIMSGIWEADKK